MKILLAVDGSKAANNAVATLIKHVAWLRDKPQIDLLCAHLPAGTIGTIHGAVVDEHARKQYYEHEAQNMLAEPKRMLSEAGLSYTPHLRIGEPASEICRVAKDVGADMIYMGTRGMNLITTFVLGSTSQKVLHLAKIPVMLVPMHES